MRVKYLLANLVVGTGLVLVCGCSSTPKSTPAAPPAGTNGATAKETSSTTAAAGKDKKSEQKASADGTITCEVAGDKRTIEIKQSSEKGCEVVYTKQGKADSVASSHGDSGYCSKAAAKIRDHLEKAGFNCQ